MSAAFLDSAARTAISQDSTSLRTRSCSYRTTVFVGQAFRPAVGVQPARRAEAVGRAEALPHNDQNCSRNTNCILRGSRAALTVPKPLMLFRVPSVFRYRLVIVGLVSPEKFNVLLMPLNCV